VGRFLLTLFLSISFSLASEFTLGSLNFWSRFGAIGFVLLKIAFSSNCSNFPTCSGGERAESGIWVLHGWSLPLLQDRSRHLWQSPQMSSTHVRFFTGVFSLLATVVCAGKVTEVR